VRSYELDSNGHVNNAVYLNYAEQVTIEHAEASGYGAEWSRARDGLWVVHRSLITHHAPALYGDELELTVRVLLVKGVRGMRHTEIRRAVSRQHLADVVTEWVWTSLSTGRPERVPQELIERGADVTAQTLAEHPTLVRDLRL
jgi:acyl-CoA thioester hydrolase